MNLLSFIDNSPTAFHAVKNICDTLKSHGFTQLYEGDSWDINEGDRCFVTRNGSSVIAFEIPQCSYTGITVCASHTDSPCFAVKSSPEMSAVNSLIRLNVEGYGGMLRESWFDRPLSVAGRIAVSADGGIEERLVNIDRDLMIIPSLAVHMGKAHCEDKINIQNEMLPILKSDSEQTCFLELVAENAGVKASDIKGCDLYLYNRQKCTVFGASKEFIGGGRLDNLENVYLSLNAFLNSEKSTAMKIHAAFDSEETGSLTRRGADSTFFTDVLERINDCLGVSEGEYKRRLANSFIMSADNAHAAHPNYIAKADPTNMPKLNGGIVIKYNPNGKYTTDSVSAAVVKILCESAGVPYSEYHNRSDISGGSTLGNLMNRHISLNSADIGLPQLAMHSSYETAGVKDAEYMEKFLTVFYGTAFKATQTGIEFI